MTGASRVPLELSRGGLEDPYKSYHLNEVTGFTNLVGDTIEDDSVESISSDTSSNGVNFVFDLLEVSVGAAMKQDESGTTKRRGGPG